jgi:adenylate cyclase
MGGARRPTECRERYGPASAIRPYTRDVASAGGATRWPLAFVAVNPGTNDEQLVPVRDMLVVGRQATVDESRQLVIEEPTVSRRHLEIRLDADDDAAYVFDTSTNGTKLNGQRIERAQDVPLHPGDRIRVGSVELEFRAERFVGLAAGNSMQTLKQVSLSRMAMVAGDILGYSTISQYTDEGVLLGSIDELYARLCTELARHHGTLNNYVGDAFFAVWDADDDRDAAAKAVSFALAALDLVGDVAPELDLRTPTDEPIRMGWGVELGPTAVTAMTGMHVVILGDATNVTFRLSALAGRDGRAPILATSRVEAAVGDRFEFFSPEDVPVKGRLGVEKVFGVGKTP